MKRLLLVLGIVGVLVGLMASTAVADGVVTYTGQGFIVDESGTANLNDERCGLTGQFVANDGGTGQFANWNGAGLPYQTGQGYLVWVLTANGATGATLNLPDGSHAMFPVGGTFKFASQYYSRDVLVNLPVTASYTGKAKGNVQLTVSHGCKPFTTVGTWCSPGFWRNADDAAWAKTGYARADLFNSTVYDSFYGATFVADPTLNTVLTASGGTYKGAGVAGTDPRTQSPNAPLNAFNATGAFLTDHIPGYHFDPALAAAGEDESCPIDNHGEWKTP